ncbi:MAG TPA: DNA translocase FtsK 4TM domain-containing protein, partial [Anaerolinea sp.]|nr:DNA translocase FtsK 4TM domain-containing protein [Anaerolinea sp.]
TILHLTAGGGWELAASGGGGGYIGAVFERVLVSALGNGGAWVMLVAWLIIAVILSLDISITDLVKFFTGLANGLSARWREEQGLSQRSAPRQSAPVYRNDEEDEDTSHELPPDFMPMP